MAVGNPISLTDNVASRIVSQTATASQTDFTISGGYRLNAISVYRNGVRLVSGRDYSAADGSTVVLLSPATASDTLQFHIFDDFRVADAIVSNASQQNIKGNITITGNIDATNAQLQSLTVTNDVSIGGTLTYEDVKNIDSVGIITARTDVHVGAGLSVVGISTFHGNAIFNGNIDLGNASSDTITATGKFDSDLIPSADDEKDLGSSDLEWRNLYLDGTANIDTLSISGISTFTGDVFIADKIVHTGDTNTAIRFPAADTITAETGGTERLRIDSSGRLLVGTDSTVFDNNFGIGMLQVTNKTGYQHVLISGHSAAAANATCLSVGRSRGTQASPGYLSSDDHIARFSATSYNGGNYQSSGAIDFFADDQHASDDLPGYISFKTVPDGSTSLTERLRITSAGNIGIGVTNPEDKLHVKSGKIRIENAIVSNNDSTIAYDNTDFVIDVDPNNVRGSSAFKVNVDTVNAVTIDDNRRIGIGTNSPDYDLHVYGGGDILVEDSNNGSAHLRLRSSNAGTDVSNWKIKTGSNNFLYIENDTAGGSQFTIDNTGKFGINDATPSVSLDLASNTDALSLPTGTTAQRPSGTDAYIRKNSTNNALEFYNGTEWVEIITDYFPTGSTTLG